MGLFSEYNKRKLIEGVETDFVLKAQNVSDIFVKKFIYTSVLCTKNFLENYINNSKNFSYLPKYDSTLDIDFIKHCFKLFAIQDFRNYMARLEANNYKLENQEESEESIYEIFGIDHEYLDIREKITQIKDGGMYATVFYSLLFKNKDFTDQSYEEKKQWMKSILLDRIFVFPQLISK